MPMDGITLGAVAEELTAALSAGRVDRIQQPEKDEIVLTIRAGGKNHKLLLSANPNHARAHLTRAQVTSPEQSRPKGTRVPVVSLPPAVTTAGTPQRRSQPRQTDLPPQK